MKPPGHVGRQRCHSGISGDGFHFRRGDGVTSWMTTRATARETTRATVGREESPSVSSPQRPTCSRRRPYIPAAVPAKYSSKNKLHLCRICGNLFFCRLLNGSACCFRQARCYRHFTCRRRLPLAARSTFLGSRDCFGHKFCRSAVADNTLTIKQKSTLPVSRTR